MLVAVYPGSFDPATNGHLDIIKRASKLADKLYVAVLRNSSKNCLFSVEERMSQLQLITKGFPNVIVTSFSGLLVEFVKGSGADVIIRGLRAVTDFEYEFQLALTNRSINPDIETLFISASTKYLFLSSSVVKEIANYGGCIDDMVPQEIKGVLMDKLRGSPC
ncbi:MAG: pantetheine-phosphate adenylyltransferase [Clostridiales bacterium]|jgi:pantetheine-phosphate adenylyltransferase|nr:pantetheine-phosphate adenylyltransferase [Clostridiales bacterium]